MDAVARDGEVIVSCVSEHVENAGTLSAPVLLATVSSGVLLIGVHSGDATIVHPAVDLTQATMNGCLEIAGKIAKALRITGPFNIQFIAKVRAVLGRPLRVSVSVGQSQR